MVTELLEYGCKVDKKVKAVKRKMYREPIVMRSKLGLRSTLWIKRKKETSNQKRMKKQEFKK